MLYVSGNPNPNPKQNTEVKAFLIRIVLKLVLKNGKAFTSYNL